MYERNIHYHVQSGMENKKLIVLKNEHVHYYENGIYKIHIQILLKNVNLPKQQD